MKIVPIVIGVNNRYTQFVFITHPEYPGAVIPEKNDYFIKIYQANHKIDKIGLWGSLLYY